MTPALATEDTDSPSSKWLKDELLNYALNLDLEVDGSMTKAQILAAIEAA
ncbi:hypothetical protein U6G28_08780 [Actinomycetaceae bacterium MB13-C1-2]|nr:hypothetical protein U6G28_08780 [Actinomycetaceae bacterium MB13-C1-2]